MNEEEMNEEKITLFLKLDEKRRRRRRRREDQVQEEKEGEEEMVDPEQGKKREMERAGPQQLRA